MYWIYDIPNGLLGLIIVLAFLAFAMGGVFLTRKLPQSFAQEERWADHVAIVLEGAFVFFGLLLALVAIAAYEDFANAREKTAAEASELGSLYRGVSGYPEPVRGQLQSDLRDYTKYVIEEAWPEQVRGIIPTGAEPLVTTFEDRLVSFEPRTNGQIALHSATLFKFNDFVRARRERLHLVEVGLPGALWQVLAVGALLTIALTWLLPVGTLKGHLLVSGASAVVVGLLIFITAAMDRPFRGEFSVSPDAFEVIQHDVMSVSAGP